MWAGEIEKNLLGKLTFEQILKPRIKESTSSEQSQWKIKLIKREKQVRAERKAKVEISSD